ncbi:hypothetical protein Goarm_013753, partial [Gossypium armourianum]|nr:hypothetical protein [Gossypium armourianum]
KQGHNKVIIQFAKLEVVKAICDRQLAGASIYLVRRIQQILSRENKWFVRYLPRENNHVADALAKMTCE